MNPLKIVKIVGICGTIVTAICTAITGTANLRTEIGTTEEPTTETKEEA